MSEIAEFRSEVRGWLAENCPEGVKGPGQIAVGSTKIELEPDVALWLERCAEKGFTAPTWPTEFGGGGLSTAQAKVFYEEMVKAISISKRNNISTALLYVNLDNFKHVNDSHGYVAGDKVLRKVADILKECTRPHDIVARLGGDEFCVLSSVFNNEDECLEHAKVFSEKLLQEIKNNYIIIYNYAR